MSRAVLSVLALLFVSATARAQQATVVRVSAPDTEIRSVGWSSPARARPSPRPRLAVEYREPRGVGLPIRNEPPDEARRLPLRSHPPDETPMMLPPGEDRPTPRPPRKRHDAALITLEVGNESAKAIKAVEWDFSLVGPDGAAAHSFRFRTEADAAPREAVTHRHILAADDRWRSFERAARTKGSRVVVTMLAVVYADGSEWRRSANFAEQPR